MYFGEFPVRYLVRSFPEAKDEIYKAFLLLSVEAAQGEVWDEDTKRLVALK